MALPHLGRGPTSRGWSAVGEETWGVTKMHPFQYSIWSVGGVGGIGRSARSAVSPNRAGPIVNVPYAAGRVATAVSLLVPLAGAGHTGSALAVTLQVLAALAGAGPLGLRMTHSPVTHAHRHNKFC